MINKIKRININVVLFIAGVLCIEHTFAQQSPQFTHKRFGLMAGMNLSNMNFNKGYPAPAVPVSATWKNGITLGFLVQVPIAKELILQPEYYYTKRNGSDKSNQSNYSIQYLSLPVLLNYKISPRISILAGLQAELLIHAGLDSGKIRKNITHDVEERSIGLVAGADVQLVKSLFISARFMEGLNHIGIGQRSDVREFKYEVVNLCIGIRF